MKVRWHKHWVDDNEGRPMPLWESEDGRFELSENYNAGRQGGWMFELLDGAQRVGLYRTLREGQRAADDIAHPQEQAA